MNKLFFNIHHDFAGLAKYQAIDYNSLLTIKLVRFWARITYFFALTHSSIKLRKYPLKTASTVFNIHWYHNKTVEGKRPCLIYFPGGGFILPAFNYHKKMVCEYATKANCDVILVNYPLVPRYQSSAILDASWYAIEWIFDHTEHMELDLKKLAIGGDSAGATLAAAMTQKTYDQKGPNAVQLQLLIFPALDNKLLTQSMQLFNETPVWNTDSTRQMWQAYLDNRNTISNDYSVPALRKDLSGLPKAYIENAEFDPLRDEAVDYAERLRIDTVPVELKQTKGTIHGFDAILSSSITKESIAQRVQALKKLGSKFGRRHLDYVLD